MEHHSEGTEAASDGNSLGSADSAAEGDSNGPDATELSATYMANLTTVVAGATAGNKDPKGKDEIGSVLILGTTVALDIDIRLLSVFFSPPPMTQTRFTIYATTSPPKMSSKLMRRC